MKKMAWKQARQLHDKIRMKYRRGELIQRQIRMLESFWWWRPEVENSSERKKVVLLEMAKKGERRPKGKKPIAAALRNYTNKSSCTYDKKFFDEIKNVRPDWFVSVSDRAIENFRDAVQWIVENDRVPSKDSKNIIERRHGVTISNAKQAKRGKYGAVFHQEYDDIAKEANIYWLFDETSRFDEKMYLARKCFEWCRKNKRLPSKHSRFSDEKKLAIWLVNQRRARAGRNCAKWYPELLDIASRYGFPDIFDDKSVGLSWESDARECFSFCKKIGRLPRNKGGDPEETKWGIWLLNRRRARFGKSTSAWHPEYLDIAAEYGFPHAFDPQRVGRRKRI